MRKISSAAREALSAQKETSTKETRKRLDQAMKRLVAGTPQALPAGSRLTASNVAKEAGVDRATLYRFHRPILDAIRQAETNSAATPRKQRRTLSETEAKLKEYRTLVEEAQGQVAALARINYRLDASIHELEELIRVRDQVISDLQMQLNQQPLSSSVSPLKRNKR
ncbi:TetR family transcriptional regulator [Paraburkholderia sabiae]|uniref:TetR family transcriptional regulator n=1 Tax=Paraburkholderia sabiae TaxID=273251 RepID=A0ABU9QJ37_9BURK|nr:TetR family transcriptional regulator [Paraburkholderia sabiae]WJZ79776.1 TetR family transcriptional regulator [Paraburkholderia sabiae]CAD6559290.1 hypothetical protein LMG24235_06624 [Paraburkholderia sabiae]